MAFGKHWEWRGFGVVDATLRARIESLPLLYATDQPLVDTYLWTPACSANIKLRFGDLKFKRFIKKEGEFECWLEEEREVYPFPLAPEVLVELEQALGTTWMQSRDARVDREGLMFLLSSTQPPVQLVTVEKQRRLYEYKTLAGQMAIVELTDISRPEQMTSVALEAGETSGARETKLALGLNEDSLHGLNYLQALAYWSRGDSLNLNFAP